MNNKGFTLIELLFAIALSAIFLPAMVFVFSFSLGAASQGESYTQAYILAQEQMEAIYYIKENNPDNDWNWTLSSPVNTNGDFYQLSKSGNEWHLGLTTSSPTETDGYKTTVEIESVQRDGAGNIIGAGGPGGDPTSRMVTVTVSWNEKGEDTSIDLDSYVTKY
jgi:prepilin-type N-terminal cleavage/methylation domain-containing protein